MLEEAKQRKAKEVKERIEIHKRERERAKEERQQKFQESQASLKVLKKSTVKASFLMEDDDEDEYEVAVIDVGMDTVKVQCVIGGMHYYLHVHTKIGMD